MRAWGWSDDWMRDELESRSCILRTTSVTLGRSSSSFPIEALVARNTVHLLFAAQTVLLLLVIPWSWLFAGGEAGHASRLNSLLLIAGVYLLHGRLAASIVGAVGRVTKHRAANAVAAIVAWAWALGPWLVITFWWTEPFANMPRTDRALSVGLVTGVGLLVGTLVAVWIARRSMNPRWQRISRLHLTVVTVLTIAGGGVFLWGAVRGVESAGAEDPPNIVLLVVDAMRRDVTGPHGGPNGLTPNLDSWAMTATVFDGAIANGPTSIPGHASLLSGRGVEVHGAFTNRHSLAGAPDGIAHRLRERGYTTVGVCANQLISRRSGFADGFDLYWSTTQSRLAGAPFPLGVLDVPVVRLASELFDVDVAALSIELVAHHLPQPFFLFAQVLHTHVPYQDRVGWTTPARVDSLTASYERGELLNTTGYPHRELAHFHAKYLGAVHSVDTLFGRWRARLAERYGTDRVRWILTADHGEILGEHGRALVGEHEGPFNASLRIPLIADTPFGGRRIDTLTGQDRVAALAAWLSGPSALPLEDVVAREVHFALTDSAYVLLDDSLKVVWSRSRPEQMPTFHRWREDRFDRHGRPIDESPRATELYGELFRLIETADLAARMQTTETLDEERLRALRALGYIE